MKLALSILAPVILLSGCAIGKSNFSCNGLPEGITCMSASEVYDQTNGNGSARKGKDGSDQKEVVTRTVTLGGVTPPPDRAVPVRTEPEVLRIMFSPWEDQAGYLNAGGYVFSEVTPRKWSVGDVPHAGTRVLHSINDSTVAAAPVAPLRSAAPQAAPADNQNSNAGRPPSRARRPTPNPRAGADSEDAVSPRGE